MTVDKRGEDNFRTHCTAYQRNKEFSDRNEHVCQHQENVKRENEQPIPLTELPDIGQCNVAENLNVNHINECAFDCNGELIGGCTLIEEWHLPFVGAEVVCVPNSISGEYEEENNGKCDFTANVYGSQGSEFSHDLDPNIDHLYFDTQIIEGRSEPPRMISYTTKTVAEINCAKANHNEMKEAKDEIPENQRPPLLRRCSYEEMVHVENDDDSNEDAIDITKEHIDKETNRDRDVNRCDVDRLINLIRRSLIGLTQWALTLQEVYEERETSGLLKPEHFICNCVRASNINGYLSELEAIYLGFIEKQDISGFDETENKVSDELHHLTQKQAEVQNILRTHVSIQVSVPAGRETRSKAAYIVGEVIHPKEYVKDAIKSVKSLVNDLLNTETCEKCSVKEERTQIDGERLNEQDINYNINKNKILAEMTIKTENHNPMTNGDDEHNISKNKRKRKQIFLQLQQEEENYSQDDVTDKTSMIPEQAVDVNCKTNIEDDTINDQDQLKTPDSCVPVNSDQPTASKRAKTFKQQVSQKPDLYSSPPRPRCRSLILKSEDKNKNKIESKPIIRNPKLKLHTSNPVLKPLYLRQVHIPPDEPNVMYQFLECKRKIQRVDGLYDWVLWKETLRESMDLLNHKSRYEKLSSLNKSNPRL